MTTPRRWFDRKFELGLAAETAPKFRSDSRARPTPRRRRPRIAARSPHAPKGRQMVDQENAGHLSDLESLWDQRLEITTPARRSFARPISKIARHTKPLITIARSRTSSPISRRSATASWKGSRG